MIDDEDEEGDKQKDGDERRILCGVCSSAEESVREEEDDWVETFRVIIGAFGELFCVLEPDLDLGGSVVGAESTDVAPTLSSADILRTQGNTKGGSRQVQGDGQDAGRFQG